MNLLDTPATEAEREAQIARMCTLRNVPTDIVEHLRQTEGRTADHIARAVDWLVSTSKFFPTPAELVQALEKTRPRTSFASKDLQPTKAPKTVHIPSPFGGPGITVTITKDWYDDCTACEDTGWAGYWCGPKESEQYSWLTVRRCGNTREHAEHEYVTKCPCGPTNATIQRRRGAA